MYNLEDNLITGKIDGYTNEYNPISREEFTLVSDDWSITNNYIISKDIETDDGVTVLFDVLTPLAYKDVVGVSVSFTSNGDVQSVGIGDEDLIQYCNKDTTDERAKPDGYTGTTVEECEKDTISKNMWNFEVPNTLTNEKNYTIGDDLYLFNWSQDELKTILFDEGLRVRITYTPIASDDNVSTSDHIQISDLVLNVYFVNELQDEIDIIENRLECINLQQLINTQGNVEFRYHYSPNGDVPSVKNLGEWSTTPLEPNSANPYVYYIVLSYSKSTEEYSDVSNPELYAEYTEISTNPPTMGVVYYEYIYKVNNNPTPPYCPLEIPSTGIAPTGWSVLYEYTSNRFPYGWKCKRQRIKGQNWGKYEGVINTEGKDVAIAYSSEEVDVDDIMYQYCYILVHKDDAKPPVLEYYMNEEEYNNHHPHYIEQIVRKYGQLPSSSFSFKRPSVSEEYPYLYAFRRTRNPPFEWSLWRGCSSIYREYTVDNEIIYYVRYTGILIDNYNSSGKEDTVQYCYKGSNTDVSLKWSDNSNECYEGADGRTPNQSDDFIPQGFDKTIDYQSADNFYPYRLKRVKHLDRWSMWSGDKEVYYK